MFKWGSPCCGYLWGRLFLCRALLELYLCLLETQGALPCSEPLWFNLRNKHSCLHVWEIWMQSGDSCFNKSKKKITVECSEWIHLSLELSQKLEEQAKGEAYVWLVSWSPNLGMCCLMFFCQPSTVWHMVTMKTVVAAVCIQCLPCARNSAQPNSSQP